MNNGGKDGNGLKYDELNLRLTFLSLLAQILVKCLKTPCYKMEFLCSFTYSS